MASIEIKKRDLYIVFVLVVILGGGFVVAQAGVKPNPGHPIEKIQSCDDTAPFLIAVDDGLGEGGFIWGCSTADDSRGPLPLHNWEGTSLQFQNQDGTLGAFIDFKGDECSVVDTAVGGDINCEDGSSTEFFDGGDCSVTDVEGGVVITCGENIPVNLFDGPKGDTGGGSSGGIGAPGISCWDLNGDGICQTDEAGVNGDSVCSVDDCQGGGSGTGEHVIDGTNCLAGVEAARGVDKLGNAQGCFTPDNGTGSAASDVVCVDCIDGSEIVDGSLSIADFGWEEFLYTPIFADEFADSLNRTLILVGEYDFCKLYAYQVDKGMCDVSYDVDNARWELTIFTSPGAVMDTACGAVCLRFAGTP